jgi:mitotic spindle assembly checkpoint protein MAD2B
MDAGPSIPASQASHLLSSFTTFLTLTLHTLLYHRALYPSTTFLTARALNLPVHQSRHPGLCTWINDAVSAVAAQLRKGAVRRIAVVMHAAKTFDVLERWVFDVETFPTGWGDREEATYNPAVVEGAEEEEGVNWTDVNEAFRGALRRVAHAAEMMPALPEGSTFTLAVELRDEASAPIGVSLEFIS